MMHRVVGVVLAGAALLSGCAASSPSENRPDSLSGTSWTLMAFRQTAGNAAEIRPTRLDQYRLSFQADGRLVAQMDCNQGSGTWQATPAESGGNLHLGPIALTRMMCPPDPLGQRPQQDMEAVQSYRIINGQLQLELAGNAGSYIWARALP